MNNLPLYWRYQVSSPQIEYIQSKVTPTARLKCPASAAAGRYKSVISAL